MRELQQRVEAFPEDPFWPHALGLELMSQERWEEAEAAFREALRRDPRHHPTHYQLGILYEKLGREAEAIAILREGMHLAEDARDLALLRDFRSKLVLYLGLDES
uniref:Tetratricopeptide repeat domain protein n=1 Tax=uncultured Bacteroidota bacterium TaxID=152509 RepID=H5SMR8_9BACT|nr:tetratricopeptide repeat domain protein [uncultured Bacteroidetes bacterium]